MDIEKAALVGALVGVLVWHDVCISRQGRYIRHLSKLMHQHMAVTIDTRMEVELDRMTRSE